MKIDIKRLFGELVRRAEIVNKRPKLRCDDFIAQNNALDDRSQLRAFNCTRRAGKSITAAIDMSETCLEFEGVSCLYMALTLGSAREIIWDVLKDINDKNDLGGVANEARLDITFPNKSKIKLSGADCSEKQMRKVLGQKYKKIFIDEAGSFTVDMNRLVYQMCEPTLIDLQGQLTLLGTCENIPLTFFEDVTSGKESGWSVHKWDTRDNPFMRVQWEEQIAMMIERNPNVINTSWYKTHYLNQWCTDDDLMIIKLMPNTVQEGMPVHRTEYEYILGVDLGFNDASAFSVMAYHEYEQCAYVVESMKKSGLDFTGVFLEVKKYLIKYPASKIIIDGANKQGVEELRRRFGLTLQIAEKSDKAIYLRILRDDVIEGKLKILADKNNELITEWKQLQWKDKRKEDEDPRCQNHLSDSVLYAWRECRHYYSSTEPKKYSSDSEEYMDEMLEKELEDFEKAKQEEEFLYGV